MKKTKSTFERVMEDPKQKEAFEKEYATDRGHRMRHASVVGKPGARGLIISENA